MKAVSPPPPEKQISSSRSDVRRARPHRHALQVLAVTLALAAPLPAKTIYVDRAAPAGGSGKEWAEAYRYLQDALNDPTLASGDEIWVATGTYFPDNGTGQTGNDRSSTFAIVSGVSIYGGFQNGDTFGQRDPAVNTTTLSGDLDQDETPQNNSYHVVTASGTNPAVLDGFVITNGNADGSGTDANGGGLYTNTAENLSITDCHFRENQGGIGGAVFNGALVSSQFIRCRFSGNKATTRGGAIANIDKAVTFTSCLFENNTGADDAGAVFNRDSESSFTNCAFSGNAALLDDGGAMLNTRSPVVLVNCSFQGNAAGADGGANPDGGAIFNWDNSHAQLINCIIWDNAEDGNTGTTSASVLNAGGSSPSYSHCLVQNLNPGGSNLNGNMAANAPRFLLSMDPLTAPQAGARLHPAPGSPVIDAGDNSVPAVPDLAGFPRAVGGIDLGAYEMQGSLYVDDTAKGSDDGSSWANAFPTLQQALAAAPGNGKLILVAAGTYYPDEVGAADSDSRDSIFSLGGSLRVLGSYPDGGGTYASRDAGSHPSVLSGDIDQDSLASGNSYHVLEADGPTARSFLDGFVITAGYASGAGGSGSKGAGLICATFAAPTLVDCHFKNNLSGNQGAAVDNTFSLPLFIGCSFENNHADTRGGAVFNSYSDPRFYRCVFRSNSAGTWGGAMRNDSSAPSFTNCTFRGNSAGSYGGAVFNAYPASRPIFRNCVFQGNTAGASGGVLFNADSSLATLVNCTLQGNSAGSDGGGIYNNNGSFSLANCVIWNNAANGSTSSLSASFKTASGVTSTYQHSLVENFDPGGTNLDGTLASNNPLFVNPTDPLTAPQPHGDLRFAPNSPLLDAGLNTANSEPTDLGTNPRIQGGTIDIGAHEGAVNISVLWKTDLDGDGIPWGVEHALGSNPDSPDASAFQGPAFNLAGHASLLVPQNPYALPGTVWVLKRSTDLLDFDDEIWRFDGSTHTVGANITYSFGFIINDENPPTPKAFYRFEAEYQGP